MTLLSEGIAHLSFAGGSLFLPTRNPADRQRLGNAIVTGAHLNGVVQVIVNEQRWLVRPIPNRGAVDCSRCGAALDTACSGADEHALAHCVDCIFVRNPAPPPPPLDSARTRTQEIEP